MYLGSGHGNIQSSPVAQNVDRSFFTPILITNFWPATRARIDDDVTICALKLVDCVDVAKIKTIVEKLGQRPPQV